MSNQTGLSSSARQSMQAVLQDASHINATQGLGFARVASFNARATGIISLTHVTIGVLVGASDLRIDASLVEEICGEGSGETTSGFEYSINNFWLSKQKTSAVGDACGPAFTGNHWDPTAACGPDSGNPACGECFTKIPYVCNKKDFQWWNANQYKKDNTLACELGDLSTMFGTLKVNKEKEHATVKVGKLNKEAILLKDVWGITQMSAIKGVIYDKKMCKEETPGFFHASSNLGVSLNQLGGKSIVVSCPEDSENAGERLICAKLI